MLGFKVSGLAAAVLLLAACDTATVPLADSQLDAQGRRFAPPPGQGSIYVYRIGDSGTLFNIAVGQRALGPIGNYSWFVADVPPGIHQVRCTGPEDSKLVEVSIGADETRFVEIDALSGWWALRCGIAEKPAAEGRAGVLRGKRALELR